ncbi:MULTISPECIES: hypothetical protein [unclassified Streptomyces]|uniref:hypothetical protein n=1 Tax=unclassified Streptomyces TaxID=2593676 RepID=UPI0027407709|nr:MULTISPECIES: hypothetical protein [unclassified Streptomyces]
MSMTRRGILKGLAAAPFVSAAGALLTPTAAEAATIDAGQFALTSRSGNSYGEFAGLTAGLAAKLPTVDATAVIADTNRNATHLGSAPGTVEAFATGFTWDGGDQAVDYWIPQGVTTSADAYGNGLYPSGGSKKVVLVSWYFETDPDGDGVDEYAVDKGIRLTFVDYTTASTPTYRHVLLVEPVRTGSGEYSFNPIRKHAGGIMWYGNLLYVVDTYKGLRVFDLNTLLTVATGVDVCGLHTDGNYYGYGYKYVLPQSHAYDNAGKYLRCTTIGLDRASTPDSLVISEYSTSGTVSYTDGTFNGTGVATTTPKVVRWNLDYTDRLPASLTASEAVTVAQQKIQGVVSRGSKHYLSVSAGPSTKGALRTFSSGASSATTVCDLGIGCEDLSYHSSGASGWAYSESVIWNLSEYAGKRYVYAVHADGS